MADGQSVIYCQHPDNKDSEPVSVFLNQLAPDVSMDSLKKFEIPYSEIAIKKLITKGAFSAVKLGKHIGGRENINIINIFYLFRSAQRQGRGSKEIPTP